MSHPKSFNRRAVLKGMGGAMLSLPFLEIMMGSEKAFAQAGGGPKRFAAFMCGQSLGADYDPKNFFVPTNVGAGYTPSVALQPLTKWSVQGDLSVVTGLRIPMNTGPAHRDASFHPDGHAPQWNGVNLGTKGEGADQIIARTIGAQTKFQSLHYQAQAAFYLPGYDFSGRNIFTWKKSASGQITNVVNQVSPKAAFDSLFSGFVAPGGMTNTAAQMEAARRKSVLDLVLGESERLKAKLGTADRQRVERHFDEIRSLERRIASVTPVMGGSCKQLMSPGQDPAVGARSSDEAKRIRIFLDLIYMAFVCDMTRVATLMMTTPQCHMDITSLHPSLASVQGDQHELGHGPSGVPKAPAGTPFVNLSPNLSVPAVGGSYAMSLVQGWHVDHFCYLIDKMKNTPEGAGTLLDSSAMVLMFEGGHGPVTNDGDMKSFGSHSTDNMAMLIAGRAGGLKPGKHLRLDGVHPAQVTVSAMKAVGGPAVLGEISGGVNALFTT